MKKGYKFTPEQRKRSSEGAYKRKGKNRLGKFDSVETKRKRRKALEKFWKEHPEDWEKSRNFLIQMNRVRSGEKSPLWRGGISNYPYPDAWTEILRQSIRERDCYTCQLCGIHQDELVGRFKFLDVHHIDYNKENLAPINLVSLCRSCHLKTNFDRKYWINYFKKE